MDRACLLRASNRPPTERGYDRRIDPRRGAAPKQSYAAVDLIVREARDIQQLRSERFHRSPDHLGHRAAALYRVAPGEMIHVVRDRDPGTEQRGEARKRSRCPLRQESDVAPRRTAPEDDRPNHPRRLGTGNQAPRSPATRPDAGSPPGGQAPALGSGRTRAPTDGEQGRRLRGRTPRQLRPEREPRRCWACRPETCSSRPRQPPIQRARPGQPASARSTRLRRPIQGSASRAAPSLAHLERSAYSRPRLLPARATARARRRRRTHVRSNLDALAVHHLLPRQACLNDALACWHCAWRHVDFPQSGRTVPPVRGVVPRTARSIRGQTSFAMSSIERRASAGSVQSCPV